MTVSQLMKGDSAALQHLESCDRTTVFIPQPVISEIAFGLARMPPSKRKGRLQQRLRLILSEINRIEWTDEVSHQFGRVKSLLESKGKPLEDFDIAIAAHALAEDAILVSANLKHMNRVPELKLENWA